MRNSDWRDWASCSEVDPDLFFPSKGGSLREARTVCNRCPVRRQCLEFALAHMESELDAGHFGIWAATSIDQRRVMVGMPPRNERVGGTAAAA